MATNAELQAKVKELEEQLAETQKPTEGSSKESLTEEDELIRKAKELNEKAREIVTIRLFKDGGRYKDDLFVQVNTYKALIPRGKDVKVPKYVAEVIENMNEQITYADKLVDELVDEFEENTKNNLG